MRELIKDLCRKKGVSMKKAEADLGVAGGYLSKINKSSPSAEILRKMADYFEVSTDYLTGKPQTGHRPYTGTIGALIRQDIISMMDEMDADDLKKLQQNARFILFQKGGE